jgi:glycosyltransferase involved in cell wall biosynthesis
MPCYNVAHFLISAIDSILQQSYQHLELILINDGSTDTTQSICEQYKEKDHRIQLINNPSNLGLVKSLNIGIAACKGSFIARMDGDDISEKQRIEEQLHFMLTHPEIAVVGSGAIAIDLHGQSAKKSNPIYLESSTLAFSAYFTQPFFHGSIMAHAAVLKENPYERTYTEDFDLWLRLVQQGKQLANIPTILYRYRNNPEGVSNSNSLLQVKAHNEASWIQLQKKLGRNLNKEAVNIANNRPIEPVQLSHFKEALRLLAELYVLQDSKNTELKRYYQRQQIDIGIQAFKKGTDLLTKSYLLLFLLGKCFHPKTLAYLLGKFS